ncbi:MAG TPA: L-seryl-tRNA(Sec) selenium transferase [Gallionella sp.]|nr:L-seryl-tRNA(Sec) selenium transferase [Gallionella sp.]
MPTFQQNAADESFITARQAASPTLVGIPSVDRVLNMGATQDLIAEYGRAPVTRLIRSMLAVMRESVTRGDVLPHDTFSEPAITVRLKDALEKSSRPALRTVFNLTGTVLHTNMGRALMPKTAVTAVVNAMTRPCNLEYDIGSGARGDRDALVEDLLCELTGAEAATVVNNNAAAVFLALNTLGSRKEVVVSRGELVEIGGAFRVPDIMARAGCRLKEVGTTNRTHLKDFAEVISSRTAMLLKVHTSNYAIQGFTAAVSEQALAELAHKNGIPVMVDLGSGTLVDLEQFGLPKEPTPQESLGDGVDLVTFSGDKLLGGPQAGIIAGRKDLIAKIKKNPLKRALRVDKMTYAALESVLRLYRAPERLTQTLPTLRLLTRSQEEIETTAKKLLPIVERVLAGKADIALRACYTQIGSGSLPVDMLPSVCIAVTPLVKGKGEGTALKKIEQGFRSLPVPVIGRIADGAFCLDLRCLENSHMSELAGQLETLRF